ncbi:MAG: hypothetical protein OES09_10980 [Gammaproteobacteria bacterium]|nr:hypothetical protein [Gammaproteobacteria bacterium]
MEIRAERPEDLDFIGELVRRNTIGGGTLIKRLKEVKLSKSIPSKIKPRIEAGF